MCKKVLIIGGTRGLGRELSKTFPYDYKVCAVGSGDLDVTKEESVKDYFDDYIPDVLVFSAVFNCDNFLHKVGAFVEDQIQTNAIGLLHVLRYVLPGMRERGSGIIINMSSILADRPMMGTGIYSACKAFGESLIRTTALENASRGIRANTLQLGYYDAGLMHEINEDSQKLIIDSIPMKRIGTVLEFVGAVHFLIENSYVNGSTLQIAGGLEAK